MDTATKQAMQDRVDAARSAYAVLKSEESWRALWAAVDATGLRGTVAHLLAMGSVRL